MATPSKPRKATSRAKKRATPSLAGPSHPPQRVPIEVSYYEPRA